MLSPSAHFIKHVLQPLTRQTSTPITIFRSTSTGHQYTIRNSLTCKTTLSTSKCKKQYVGYTTRLKDRITDTEQERCSGHDDVQVNHPTPSHVEVVMGRRFQFSWLTLFKWLRFSKHDNGGYCLPCGEIRRQPTCCSRCISEQAVYEVIVTVLRRTPMLHMEISGHSYNSLVTPS